MYRMIRVNHEDFDRTFPPTVAIQANSEYGTRVEIALPSDQIVTVYIQPDYTESPKVVISIGVEKEE